MNRTTLLCIVSIIGTYNTDIMNKRDNIHFCVGENFVATVRDDGGALDLFNKRLLRCSARVVEG